MPARYRRYYDTDTGYSEDDRYAPVRSDQRGDRQYGKDDMALVRRSRTQESDGYGSDRVNGMVSRRRSSAQRDFRRTEDTYIYRSRPEQGRYEPDEYYYSRRSRERRDSAPDYRYQDYRGQRFSRSGQEPQSRGGQDQQRGQLSRQRDQSEQQPGQLGQQRGQSGQQRGQSEQQRGQSEQQRGQQERQQGQQQQQQQQSQRYQNQDQEAKDGEGEEKQDFMSRHFDTGMDGWITSAAGAALGAITARHFGGPGEFSKEGQSKQGRIRKNWKSIAGAAVGAIAANAAESSLKTYFEEETKEHMADGGEFVGEVLGAVGPDVL